MNWKQRGNCNGEPPQVFYWKDPSRAKSICHNCSVQEECFLYAVRHSEYGVWGGYTEGERKQMYVSAIVQAVPLVELLRRNKREQERPANVYPLRWVYRSVLKSRNRDASERVAALPPLIFGKVCTT